MAGTLAELEVNIIGNTKSLDTAIDGSKRTVDKFDGKLNDLSKTVKKLLGAGALIAIAKKIADIGVESIKAASTAEEVGTKFNFAFRGIEAQAEATAVELAKTYGLAQTESKKLLGDTGDLLKGFGASANEALDFSAEIQRLSVDLADYNTVQGGAARVSKILTKSVLGNKDGLSELGVSLLDVDIKQELVRVGQDKLTGQAGKLAKAQATYRLILEQTEDAQGSFARSTGSYEQAAINAEVAVKDLQVQIGRALLPTATKGVGVFADLTKSITDNLTALIDARKVYDSFSKGQETVNDKLFVVKKQIAETSVEIDTLEDMYERATDPKFKKKWQDQLVVLYEQNQVARRIEKAIQLEIKAKQDKIDAENEEQRLIDEKKKKEKEAADARAKQYIDQDKAVQAIISAGKTDLEIIDEQIAFITKLSLKESKFKEDQLAAVKLLQDEKQKILDEEEEAEDKARDEKDKKDKDANDKEIQDEKDKFQEKISLYKDYADQVTSFLGSIVDIVNAQSDAEIASLERVAAKRIELLQEQTEQETALNDFKTQLKEDALKRSIEETTQEIADLRAVGDEDSIQEANALQRDLDNSATERDLDTKAVESREARATEIEQIEKDLAAERYKIELEQFKARKAIAVLDATIATATAVAQNIGIPPLAIAIGVAGAAQVAAIVSQPDPAPPKLATGAFIPGSQRGTNVIVGEDGADEEIFGMGSKGVPRRRQLVNEVASGVVAALGGGNVGTVVNFNSLVSVSDTQQLRQFAQTINPFIEEVQEGRL